MREWPRLSPSAWSFEALGPWSRLACLFLSSAPARVPPRPRVRSLEALQQNFLELLLRPRPFFYLSRDFFNQLLRQMKYSGQYSRHCSLGPLIGKTIAELSRPECQKRRCCSCYRFVLRHTLLEWESGTGSPRRPWVLPYPGGRNLNNIDTRCPGPGAARMEKCTYCLCKRMASPRVLSCKSLL